MCVRERRESVCMLHALFVYLSERENGWRNMREYVAEIHQRQQLRLGRSIEKRIAFHLFTFFLSDCLLLLDFSSVPGSLTFLILYLPFSRKTNLSVLC